MDEMVEDSARLMEGYRRVIERALEHVPVRNGVVSIRDLWLETALPMDLIVELIQGDGIKLPDHVARVDLRPTGRRGKHGRRR